MQVLTSDFNPGLKENAVISVGTFDGVHLGHLEIIKKLLSESLKYEASSVLVTFEPHPRTVICSDYNIKLLNSREEKLKLLESYGIDRLWMIEFNTEFASLKSSEFIEMVLEKFAVKSFITGFNNRFGHDRQRACDVLPEYASRYGFSIEPVGPFSVSGEGVSSTRIRRLLEEGEVQKAGIFLGRSYSLKGSVTQGDKRGRTLGFPTANVDIDEDGKLIPKNGVYVVSCELSDGQHFGIADIGLRPTFKNQSRPLLEVHLLDFNGDLYGQNIETKFLKKLRDEVKFNSALELISQLQKDRNEAIEFISTIN